MITTAQKRAVQSFAAAVATKPLDLGEVALQLCLAEEPDLDLDAWRGELDRLGAELTARLPDDADTRAQLDALRGYLFGELGLLGNEQDYYDPANSYLHRVLQRGLGIPISLAAITIEVGRRAGIKLHGVGFPAHFLVGTEDGGLFLDPFHQGRLLDEADCADLLQRIAGGSLPFSRKLLARTPTSAILVRMLRNLKGCHLRRSQLDLALLDVERLLLLDPDLTERRDRGLIQLARGAFAAAIEDLEAYLADDPPDARDVRLRLDEARRGLEASD
jgi:regulator of sirC expression with transglutaminase-like and TPR domain